MAAVSKGGDAGSGKVPFMGVEVAQLDAEGLLARTLQYAALTRTGERRPPKRISYLNADCALLARRDAQYRAVLNRFDLIYADGVGIVLGARMWGHHLPGRMTAADFMIPFCRTYARNGLSVYLLGGREGIAAEAGERMCRVVPNLRLAGTHHGYFDPCQSEPVVAEINRARPDILLVGFGAPLQEIWIDRHAAQLDVGVAWGVGGLFDFLSGRTWRGPPWLVDHGFEWLCRLLAEPRRLWRRYLIGNLKFLALTGLDRMAMRSGSEQSNR